MPRRTANAHDSDKKEATECLAVRLAQPFGIASPSFLPIDFFFAEPRARLDDVDLDESTRDGNPLKLGELPFAKRPSREARLAWKRGHEHTTGNVGTRRGAAPAIAAGPARPDLQARNAG